MWFRNRGTAGNLFRYRLMIGGNSSGYPGGGGGDDVYIETVTGTLPQTLHAFENPMQLIRYGNVEYLRSSPSDVPTPTSPLNMVCNCGLITKDGFDGNCEVLSITDPYSVYSAQTVNIPPLLGTPGGTNNDRYNVTGGYIENHHAIMVLDGTESGWQKVDDDNIYYLPVENLNEHQQAADTNRDIMCTHFNTPSMYTISSVPNDLNVKVNSKVVVQSDYDVIMFKYSDIETVEEWKEFLADQYASGTPVILVYVCVGYTTLVGPTPLMTHDGSNVVDTTMDYKDVLNPSASITYATILK